MRSRVRRPWWTRRGVVLVDVLRQVELEAGEGRAGSGRTRPPALLEDQSVQCFDGAVGLWAAGADRARYQSSSPGGSSLSVSVRPSSRSSIFLVQRTTTQRTTRQ